MDLRGRSCTLRINYRTSHQIRRQADRLLDLQTNDVDGTVQDRSGTQSVFNGPDPQIHEGESLEQEQQHVAAWIRKRLEKGLQPRELGIFVRSEAEMPARKEEIKHAKEEGVQFLTLTNPVAFNGDEKGWLKSARCRKMELGPADESGRRRPVPIAGSDYDLPLDMVIIAVGTSGNPLVQSTTPDLKTRPGSYIEADPATLKTSKRGVFAAGDIVTGGATVILAMGAGRKAAKAINEYLTTGVW